MIKAGITGGIGSGKTTVAEYFENMGYPVIYADPLARKLMTADSDLKSGIIEILGENAYDQSGDLNPEHVANAIFRSAALKIKIEEKVHPKVISAVVNELTALEQSGNHKVAFVEAALIYETGMNDIFDYVIVVTAPEDVRVHRVVKRDNISAESVRQRSDTQLPESHLISRGDFVVVNRDSIKSLNLRLSLIERILKKKASE